MRISYWPSLASVGLMVMTTMVSGQVTTTTTTTVTATATATVAPTGTPPPLCIPAYDCSSSPKGCLNNGVCGGKTCQCMPGFGGNDCSLLSCGSPLTDVSQRATVPAGQSCASKCDAGFGGFNCNTSRTSFLGGESMVCNKKPQAFYNSFMSCAVNAPELTGFFPGNYTLTLDLDVKNTTVSAQLWLGQAEQFFCNAPSCALATVNDNGVIKTKWDCPTLTCNCIEPTVIAHMVVEQLCKLAQSKTTTVILTIHQPRSDIFAMFDHTLVVSKGEALYFGPTNTAADYFNRRGLVCPTNYNIADYLLDIAMDQELVAKAKSYSGTDDEKVARATGAQTHAGGNALARRGTGQANTSEITRTSSEGSNERSYETSVRMEEFESNSSTASLSEGGPAGKKKKTVYPTSFLTQLRTIMKRNLQTLIRDKSLLVLHLAVAIVLGVFIGGLYFKVGMDLAGFQNRAGSLFFMMALLGFSSISALGAFTEIRTLYIKERSNGYYPPMPFIISTLLFDLIPLRIVPSILMGCISYWMIGLNSTITTFFKFLLILVLFNVATAMFCLVVAAGVRTTGVASLASSIVMLFMMLFGGFLINSKQIPKALTWIQYLSMFKYGFEALAVNEIATSKLIDNIQGVAFNVPGSLILQKLFGFDLTGYWRSMIILVGLNVLMIVVFWWFVSYRLKERK
ncbi:hypothetical protein BGZ52_012494 [Haplosporangium bisporale]|nr:hypothetical protein BGZ52_012494 [Haplosporangium bisporale]